MNAKSAVLQATIDAPQLDKYFHVDQAPERRPLRIVKGSWYDDTIQLTKFGTAVLFTSADSAGRTAFEITELAVSATSAEVSFSYAVEGIRGNAKLQKTENDWVVESMTIRER